jgi:tRNA(Ile)-lysidine synthase
MIFSQCKEFIQSEKLFNDGDRLLLGVSGGVDSVVLAYLVDQLYNEFAIAHCNFNLRGKESDGDEAFVANLADLLRVPFFSVSFHTKEIAAERGVSVEMAARDLRYEWFEQVRRQNQFDYILVAHHLDDVLETFILNLTRGTGIRGLSGIKPKVGNVVRPLLFATRNEIEEYASVFGLACRYDSSNEDQGIRRNKIRHSVIPLLEQLNPSFKRNMHQTIGRLYETERIFMEKIEAVRSDLVEPMGDWSRISIEAVKKLNPIATYLYELLRPFSFNGEVISDIIKAMDKEPGNLFYSSAYRLVVDREYLIITPLADDTSEVFYIEKGTEQLLSPLEMKCSVINYSSDYCISKDKQVAVLDFGKLEFPLTIRKWQKGDYFRPLGLDGFKKISDYFIDQKLSIPEKESTWLLLSGDKVVWVIGRRIDDRFKLTPSTQKIFQIECLEL